MKKYLTFIAALVLLSSCYKNNPDPSWIEVSEWELEANPSGNPEGELTENITDAWVYIDDKLIGVFEVPFKIPVLLSGNSKIRLYPTIKNNGISSTKKIYPFMEPYDLEAELVQNQTLKIDPKTRYTTGVKFSILDFEDANLGIEESPSSAAQITSSSDPAVIQPFNGNAFGRVTLTTSLNNWIATTNFDKDLPRGQEVYLELDYHSTLDVVTGVVAIDGQGTTANPNVQFNGRPASEVEWKKIYIELKTIVSGSPSADYFEHSFESILPDSLTYGEINIDNIKVIHF